MSTITIINNTAEAARIAIFKKPVINPTLDSIAWQIVEPPPGGGQTVVQIPQDYGVFANYSMDPDERNDPNAGNRTKVISFAQRPLRERQPEQPRSGRSQMPAKKKTTGKRTKRRGGSAAKGPKSTKAAARETRDGVGDTPAAKGRHVEPAAEPPREEPPRPPAGTEGSDCWSPADYPTLEICWEPTADELGFRVTVSLVEGADDAPPTASDDTRGMVFVDTVLSAENPSVPFDLSDESAPAPFIKGVLDFGEEGSPPLPSLSVAELKFPGGFVEHKTLSPSD